ncbi:hypothetical protein VFPPC_15568 [Pochonia chlamydosporia 170]|uniref:Uncharacterized protein n=1 Tax=Pochonia chlamydosporia 170 TaxID=1380566 RepID=A0A179FZ52_METCM|nr:hypothetical protein VFPPC_15568 [Pochonia chlamydosporia 170]OAQ70333.1 hypothetical protein VFPPC_15568 [Pochonia chlamydosporia 170]
MRLCEARRVRWLNARDEQRAQEWETHLTTGTEQGRHGRINDASVSQVRETTG